jgi:hypothetical protein
VSILLSETDIAHLLADDDAYIETGEYDIDFMCKAQAIHTMKYMGEPCYEHPIGDYDHDCKCEHFLFVDSQVDDYYHWHYAHRKDCPRCIVEIHKELGI